MPDGPRLSTRLVVNAVSTYARLAANLLIGIFFAWYVIGHAGLGGFGIIALAGGGLGIAFALETAIDQSLVREIAGALAGADRARLRRVLASGLAFCAIVAAGIFAVFAAIAGAALAGFFNTPDDQPELARALAALFLAEGALGAANHLLMPYTRAIFAARRVAIDNAVLLGRRLTSPVAAVLAFGLIGSGADLATQLTLYALLHATLGLAGIVVAVLLARHLVPGLRLVRGSYDRGAFRAIAGAVGQTVQFTMFTNLTPHLLSLVINLLFGVIYNGMWQIVIQVGGHVRIVALGVLRGVDAMATHLGEEGRSRQVVNLMIQGTRYQLAIALPFATAYAIMLVPILGLWIGGRLAADPRLAAAGITVEGALAMIAFMGVVNMVAELARASTRGIERMLYGLGHVRSYAPFAKWAGAIVLVTAAIAMVFAGSPRPAPIPLAVVCLLYFDVLVPRAAARRVGLPIGAAVRGALPRAAAVAAAVAAIVIPLRVAWPVLTIPKAAVAAVIIGTAHLALVWFVVLDRKERDRLVEMLRFVTRAVA